MKLRTLAAAGTAVLIALSLLAAGALTLGSRLIDVEVAHLARAVEKVRAIQEMEIHLLVHERESTLFAMRRRPQHDANRQEAAQRLHRWLEQVRQDSRAPPPLIGAVEREIAVYFDAREAVDAQSMPPLEAYASVSRAMDRAYAAMDELLLYKLSLARVAHERASRMNDASKYLSAGLAAGIILVTQVMLWLSRTQVYRPLVALRTAIDRFASGERGARAPDVRLEELHAIATAFNGMADALEQQRERQLAILASVAHDLRNPLAALKLTVDRVRPDRPLPPEERLRPMLTRIGQQVARCDRMLDDLITIARLDGGQLELQYETRDARDLAREVVELYRPVTASHEITVSVPDAQVPLRCDPLRLEQVLNNLMTNAIKYSPSGGKVRVVVVLEPEAVAISVSDDGVGIADDDRACLFERYARVPSSRHMAPGVGLGLWAARQLVEAHGGRIDVESAPGEGSTFTVRIPVAPPRGAA